MAITNYGAKKGNMYKEVDGKNMIIYPRTTSDMVIFQSTTVENELTNNQSINETQNKNIQKLTQDLQTTNTTVDNNKKEIDQKINDIKQTITNDETILKKHDEDITYLKEKTDTYLPGQIDNHETRITELETNMAKVLETLGHLQFAEEVGM